MFQFTFGDVGSGKSLNQADTVLWLLERSVKIQKKHDLPLRPVWCNFHMSKEVRKYYHNRLFTWHDPLEMIFKDYPQNKEYRKSFDCVWDEMAVELPADHWRDTHIEIRSFFAQHRKRAIQIFGNTQDYLMVDVNARRMATRVYQSFKFVGSRDPDPTMPPIPFVWGVCGKWELDKSLIRADAMDRVKVDFFPTLTIITRRLVNAYDTTEDIKPADVELKHTMRKCKVCGKEIISHH
jgi:hypothetical protein